MRLLLLLLLTPTLLAGDYAEELGRFFRPTRQTVASNKFRARCLKSVPETLDGRDVEALCAAYLQLEKEMAPFEDKHRSFILRGLRDKSREPRPELDGLRELQATLRSILEQHAPLHARAMVETAFDGKRYPLRLRLGLAEAGRYLVGSDELAQLVKSAARARDDEDVLVALTFGRSVGVSAAPMTELAVETLAHENPILRGAAIGALETIADPASLLPLVAHIDLEVGDLRKRVVAALQVLTGQTFHGSSRAWQIWLAEEGAPFLSGDRTLGFGEPSQAEQPAGATYYGLPMDGNRLLFVLDVSQSMSKPLVEPKQGEEVEPGAETRMDRARAELVRALSRLAPHQHFDIVAFGGDLDRFAEKLVPASAKNVAAAQAWVSEHELSLGTRLHDAIELAFDQAGRSTGDGLYLPDVDTLYVLTDGQPIVNGKSDDQKAIEESTARLNLTDQVVIHTIGMGSEIPAGFLKRLASGNRGQFVHARR
ncbi:MAG: VWA domain-containing protein [Planctomycetota bacterium]|nr:VWA domain-containing protein [Planctomycetota bacterium]